MFKNKGLDIIINCNMEIVNYLDVTLNLNDGSYHPYKKPNDEKNYIHINSDHQAINRMLELKNEAVNPTDTLENKRSMQVP